MGIENDTLDYDLIKNDLRMILEENWNNEEKYHTASCVIINLNEKLCSVIQCEREGNEEIRNISNSLLVNVIIDELVQLLELDVPHKAVSVFSKNCNILV